MTMQIMTARSSQPTIITLALPGNSMSVHAVVHSVHYLHAPSVTAFVTKQAADDIDNKPSSRSLYSLEVSGMEHCYARMMSNAQLKRHSWVQVKPGQGLQYIVVMKDMSMVPPSRPISIIV